MSDQPELPVETIKFEGRQRIKLALYSETQRAILPVIGIRGDGKIEGLGTAFCICGVPPVLISARHVIESFIKQNRDELDAGLASIHLVWETDEKNPDNITDLGAPVPVFRVVYYTPTGVEPGQEWLGPSDESEVGVNSDLAILVPFDIRSSWRRVGPTPVTPLGFDLPMQDAWSYAFGYPEMSGEIGATTDGERVVNWSRTYETSAGHVTQSYPDGQPGNTLVQRPSFEMDLELPHGMSGGPILVDGLGICGVASAAIDPEHPDEPWSAYATGLAPLLELATVDDRGGGMLTLRELASLGAISTSSPLPPPPENVPAATIWTFPNPPRRQGRKN